MLLRRIGRQTRDWARCFVYLNSKQNNYQVLNQLKPIKEQQKQLSWADLIVLAGTLALEHWTGSPSGHFGFCAGRTDAEDDDGEVPPPTPTVKGAHAAKKATPQYGNGLRR